MMQPQMIYLKEPELTFGYAQKLEDPRDGLTLFGPFTRELLSGQINVGIIGPIKQRIAFIDYLRKLHKPIVPVEADVARPYFPGLESVFGVYINFGALQQIEVSQDQISTFLKYTDKHQRVHNLSNLYAEKLMKYANEEHPNIAVWFVVIPDDIYKYGRPKSTIPKSNDNIRLGLTSKEKKSDQPFLFDDLNELKEAYSFEVNFHNQLKAKLLQDKIITQVIRESTFAYSELWSDAGKVEYQRMFDTAKAWNIATTLYYKAGGLPWKLGSVREGVCYLGIVYKKIEGGASGENACCAAQMFLDSGDGMVFRGNIGPWYNPESKEFHIKRSDAFELLTMSLEAFKDKSADGSYPKEVFIHSKTFFDDEEWRGFSEAAERKAKIIGVRIRNDNSFKLYRDFSYCVPRGSALVYSKQFAYLWSNGFIPRLQTQLGLETPNPLSVEIVRGEHEIRTVCADILALTKLNYNACIFADGTPVTLRFADSIGEVLTAGKGVRSDVLPFKHYV